MKPHLLGNVVAGMRPHLNNSGNCRMAPRNSNFKKWARCCAVQKDELYSTSLSKTAHRNVTKIWIKTCEVFFHLPKFFVFIFRNNLITLYSGQNGAVKVKTLIRGEWAPHVAVWSISVLLMSVAPGEKSDGAAGCLLGPSAPLGFQTGCPGYMSQSTDISKKVRQI